jgi:N-acyl-phosphatidylethanolamine-hydrolysing phospholipase D
VGGFLGLLAALAVVEGARAEGFGPAPRDATGRFENPVGPITHGSPRVQIPFMLRRIIGVTPVAAALPRHVVNDGAFLRENATHSEPTVTWVGHATLLVQMDHVSFLTDPIWAERASPVGWAGPRRFVPPGVALEALPPIDFVLISHNHFDHLDLPTLVALNEQSPEVRFIVPLENGALLRAHGIDAARVFEVDWGETIDVEGVRIHCLPAQHWSRRGLVDERRALWSSWAVVGEDRRFYFAGDTGDFAGFAAIGSSLGPFDLAAVPIGAYEPTEMMREAHMNPEEAGRAGSDLRAQRLLGMHYGTFDLTDEPIDEPPRRFRAAGAHEGFAAQDIWLPAIGETRGF